jgi:enediyne biosynthesis protein E4
LAGAHIDNGMKFSKLIGAVLFVLLALLLAGAAIYALRPDVPPEMGWSDAEAWFRDVTDEVGLDFVHDAGDLSKYQMPQIVGSGAALFDFDGDGLLDIYLLTNGGPDSKATNRLYKNMGGTFKDVTEGSGLGIAGYNMGVAIGDINNDGRPDVLVTQYGGVKLFLNQGNGIFKDVTLEAGLKNPLWATSANFVDYDRDGWLDLVVVNYVEYDPSWPCGSPGGEKDYCAPKVFHGTVTRLFRNLGHAANEAATTVRFEDVTVPSGLARAPGPGLGVYCADFNGDGWPDIFIANDGQPNHLWINQKNGTFFTEEAFARGLAVDAMAQTQANMGVAIGDVNNDLLFDLYITHLTSERNTLWLQGPRRGLFRDRTAFTGLLHSDWRGTGFGTVMGDFDQDGWLDIAVANGRVSRGSDTVNDALGDHLKRYGERNQLFRNDGQGNFGDVSRLNPAFCGTPNVARGLARGDFTGKGSLDLLVTTVAGPARLLRNVAKTRGHWLMVQAVDPRLKRDAYGAEITVRAGAHRWLRIVNPGDSYLCSSDPRAHFGLGDAARYDAVYVLWPDGLAEVFPGGDADRLLVLRRGEGRPAAPGEVP